jgi:hypothetical protein
MDHRNDMTKVMDQACTRATDRRQRFYAVATYLAKNVMGDK